jgi:hypothetical protein
MLPDDSVLSSCRPKFENRGKSAETATDRGFAAPLRCAQRGLAVGRQKWRVIWVFAGIEVADGEGVDRDSKYISRTSEEDAMAGSAEGTKIVLQVGAELRVRNNGDVIMDNPAIELASQDGAADAVLLYRFDAKAGEHIFRLLDPVADHQHTKVHRRGD